VHLSKGVTEKGHADGIMFSIKSLMETMNLSIEQAMAALKISEAGQQRYINLLEKQQP